ncbi:unnamed protein product [Thlaspi arvense]|uniref:NYN domain-containing protein n=1 Tax=Thlaspi arvense TaxID=13288 RepID=A0AAU9RDZ8_THLAR|nr:unnamed protein product [Thlaspi arvense]
MDCYSSFQQAETSDNALECVDKAGIHEAWGEISTRRSSVSGGESWKKLERKKSQVLVEGYVETLATFDNQDDLTRSKSLTDDDLEDLKGCLDLGFGFSYDEIPELCNTLPALELCYSMSQRFLDDKQSNTNRSPESSSVDDSPSPPVANWKISSPGDNPDDVKARLKYWAQAVACTSIHFTLLTGHGPTERRLVYTNECQRSKNGGTLHLKSVNVVAEANTYINCVNRGYLLTLTLNSITGARIKTSLSIKLVALSSASQLKTAVIWDIDECKLPDGKSYVDVAENIKKSLGDCGLTGRTSMMAYGDASLVKEELLAAGINPIVDPNSEDRAEARPCLLRVLMNWEFEHLHERWNVLLILGKVEIPQIYVVARFLFKLKNRQYNILIAQAPSTTTGPLLDVGERVWDWPTLADGGSPISRSDKYLRSEADDEFARYLALPL